MLFSCLVFFFKQKTAYEMRISDWSSDVCSSDLHRRQQDRQPDERRREDSRRPGHEIRRAARRQQARGAAADAQTATFRRLHQDDADHHRGDQCLQDEYEGEKAGHHDFPNSRGLTRTALAAHIETKRLRFKPKDQPSAAAAATIGANFVAVRLAPPTSAPSTSPAPSSSAAFSPLTDPP